MPKPIFAIGQIGLGCDINLAHRNNAPRETRVVRWISTICFGFMELEV